MPNRVWAAVERDGKIVASIVDYEDADSARAHLVRNASERWWAVVAWAETDPFPEFRDPNRMSAHSHPGCGPERPCDTCELTAASWWLEWEKRDERRVEMQAKQADDSARQVGLFGR